MKDQTTLFILKRQVFRKKNPIQTTFEKQMYNFLVSPTKVTIIMPATTSSLIKLC